MFQSITKFSGALFFLIQFYHLMGTAYDTIHISDYGIQPDSRQNTVLSIQKALEDASSLRNPVLIFEPGRYDFWPQHSIEKIYFESNTTDNNPKRCAILIEDMQNLIIDGNDAEFIFHDRMQPFTVDNSSNISIKNLSVDWDIPLTTQAEVMEITDSYIDLKIDITESPYIIEKEKLVFVGEGWKSAVWGIMELERETRRIAAQTGDRGCCGREWDKAKTEELEPGLVRIYKSFEKQKPDKGNFLILRHNQRDHAGIFLYHSKDITIDAVDVYHTAGLGILSQFTENISLRNVSMIPNPEKNRYFSGHDDGFHFSNCRGQITIENCEFAALMDDPINIHGTSVRIIEKIAPNKLVCRFVHHQTKGLNWSRSGEKIRFIIHETMETAGVGEVINFHSINTQDFEITFSENIPVEIQPGDALENLSWTPDALIRNNRFLSSRARGILISTPGKVIIENNYFESSGSAILIAGDANYWYETGAVTDVIIRNNIFASSCLTSMYQFCEAIISILPEIPQVEKSKTKYHRNIRIEHNEFNPYDYPVLYAKSVEGLAFNGNSLIRSHDFTPFHSRKYTLSLDHCANVQIQGNKVSEDILGKNVLLEGMKENELDLDMSQDFTIEIKK